ncbi:MAG TPA: cation:proton antiporter [Longimicrobiales bacterium]
MRRLLTLVALVALAVALRELAVPASQSVRAAMLLGFLLLASYQAGGAAASIGLPRVTGYVLVGIVVGPFALGVLSPSMVAGLRTIDELALALIALTAGGELKIGELRRSLRSIVGVTLGVYAVVVVGMFVVVLAVRPLIPGLAALPPEFAAAIALLLGIWAANSSPDATIAVINETGAEGNLTETILGVTILKDVLVIITLAAAIGFARPLVDPAASFDAALFGRVAWEVGGALAVGAAAGFGFAVYLERIGARSVMATLVFTYILTLLASGLHVELLLTAVSAGFVIENGSKAGDELIHAIEANALVIFAIFFALAGAGLDLDALATFWAAAVAIVLVRGALTWLGARLGSAAVAGPPVTRRLAWQGLISQAGVTLGLALLVGREFPDWGDTFVAIATAVIIFHLLIGPVLLKLALVRSGEARAAGAAARGAGRTARARTP